VIKQLERTGVPSDILVSPEAPDLLRISKRSRESENRTEFSFLLRIESIAGMESWWPVEYRSAKEVVSCEKTMNGKVMVNMVRQQSLIELAETWAKSLEAQHVARTVGNALL
jgi:hypothetical protein